MSSRSAVKPGPKSASPVRKLGNYELVREIGTGGMGVVHLARQPRLERLVVLKRIRASLSEDESSVRRFQREARTAAAVHHQNVVVVYDSFILRGTHYIAQEYVDGVSLDEILRKQPRLPPRVAALIALAVVRGLEEVHAQGIMHRDLKPANLLVSRVGETKIADFGIAFDPAEKSLTQPGMLLGSLPYMSPEQLRGEAIDYRSDLFALGCTLYEMVTGKPPYQVRREEGGDSILRRMQRERYPPARETAPGLPRFLARVITRCLRAKPSRRFPSATELRRQLERKLGFVSPADCRREIAEYLWSCGVFEGNDERTELRRASPGKATNRIRPFLAKAALLLVATGAALGLGWLAARQVPGLRGAISLFAAPLSRDSNPSSSTPPLVRTPAPLREGWLHLVVFPWAEVSIDGAPPFCTPHPGPIVLTTGPHRIVFDHPDYGRAVREIEIHGETIQDLRHIWPGPVSSREPAPRPQ